jgi:hypothetical protein
MAPTPELPQDFVDLLTEFAVAEVRYLVIGGYAVGFHDRPRTTKDLDLLLEDTAENTERACQALSAFGAPREVTESLRTAGTDEIVWFGSPPSRVDLLKSAGGIDFAHAYSRRSQVAVGSLDVSILGLHESPLSKCSRWRYEDSRRGPGCAKASRRQSKITNASQARRQAAVSFRKLKPTAASRAFM